MSGRKPYRSLTAECYTEEAGFRNITLMRNWPMGQKGSSQTDWLSELRGGPCTLGLIWFRVLPKVSAFEQTRSEKVITLWWMGIPAWKLLSKLLATREPKWNFFSG
jgi:hypothetical protein